MRREPDPEAIVARARTLLVFPSQAAPVATITMILARHVQPPSPEGLVFAGPVRFAEDAQQHLRTTVLPLVHRICRLLGVATGGFEICNASSFDLLFQRYRSEFDLGGAARVVHVPRVSQPQETGGVPWQN